MDLSLLGYQLKNRNFNITFLVKKKETEFANYHIWKPESVFQNNLLYIVYGNQSSLLNKTAGGINYNFLIIGEPDIDKDLFSSALLISDEHLLADIINFLNDMLPATNYLSKLFSDFERFNIEEVIEQLSCIFFTPVAIADNALRFIGTTKDFSLLYHTSDPKVMEEEINALIWDDKFYESQYEKDVFCYYHKELNITSLCYNVFVNDIFFCRIILGVKEWQIPFLIPYLRKAGYRISQYYQQSLQLNTLTVKSKEFYEVIDKLLKNELPADVSILSQNWWQDGHTYQIIYLKVDPHYPLVTGNQYLTRQIEMLFSDCCAIQQGSCFICIRNLTLSLNIHEDELKKLLKKFFENIVVKAGISNTFSSFKNYSMYLKQAEAAIEIGEQKAPAFWYYFFKDYAYDYILKGSCRQFPASEIIAPELKILLVHDREKDSELFRTLEIYLNSKCNGLGTANQLFIHRTTFQYRLKKITELTHLNLDDIDTYIYLLISYRLYHGHKEEF